MSLPGHWRHWRVENSAGGQCLAVDMIYYGASATHRESLRSLEAERLCFEAGIDPDTVRRHGTAKVEEAAGTGSLRDLEQAAS